GHELDDRAQPGESGTDAEPGETLLGDWRVDDPTRPELLQQPLADLVGSLIFGDFLADQQDVVVAPHLLGDRVAQRLAHGLRHRLSGVFGRFGGWGWRLCLRGRPVARRGWRRSRLLLLLGRLGRRLGLGWRRP